MSPTRRHRDIDSQYLIYYTGVGTEGTHFHTIDEFLAIMRSTTRMPEGGTRSLIEWVAWSGAEWLATQ